MYLLRPGPTVRRTLPLLVPSILFAADSELEPSFNFRIDANLVQLFLPCFSLTAKATPSIASWENISWEPGQRLPCCYFTIFAVAVVAAVVMVVLMTN